VEKERKRWATLIRKRTGKLKNILEEVRKDTTVFINDIEAFINGNDNVPGSQNFIGFKNLFRGYVVKDWFSADTEQTKYMNVNPVIVRECVQFYQRC